MCVAPPNQSVQCCTPQCEGQECGDNGCGGTCNACGDGLGCSAEPVGDTCQFANSCKEASKWAVSYAKLNEGPVTILLDSEKKL